MAQTKYTYSIINDTMNAKLNSNDLNDEIQVSDITIALDYINASGDVLDIYFKDALTSEQQTTLIGIINVHEGSPVIIQEPQYASNKAMEVAQVYGDPGNSPFWIADPEIMTAGQTTFVDFEITTELELKGGIYGILNFDDIHKDDYIEASLIDKDNILGLFSLYGLTPGVDILELDKFLKTWHPKYFNRVERFMADLGVLPMIIGLYLRFAYNSSGSTDIEIASAWEFRK